jgi:DNA repair protein RecN (Recombination protein N)
MLSTLRIENIAIIDELELDFSKGLNILTGETGAGKSIILKAISLLSGKRTQGSIIRHGAEKAKVEALFILSKSLQEKLSSNFEEVADVLDGDELILKRMIDKSGRSKFYLNGSLFPVGTIAQIAEYLFDVTGQHEQQNLLSPSSHRDILDAYGIPKILLDDVETAFYEWKHYHDLLLNLQESRQEQILRTERLRTEQEELEQAAIKKGEKNSILDELSKLQHFEKIQISLSEVLSLFEGSPNTGLDSSPTLEDSLNKISTLLEGAKKHDQTLQPVCDLLEDALAQFGEVKLQTEDYLQTLSHDPEHYETLQIRLGELNRLERKYKISTDELATYLATIEKEISDFDSGVFDEDQIKKNLEEKETILKKYEEALRAERIKAGKQLSKEINNGLQELQLKKANFSISVNKSSSSSKGADAIQFLFTANPGEPPQPMDKVASGGELSRLLLLLKSISSAAKSACLQVFDEIDVGVSGAVAQIVGEKLLSIAKDSQVLIITHAAQVAALAETHIVISKEVKKDRTFSKAKILNEAERMEVIAGMLAGKEVSKEFLLSAKELMKARDKYTHLKSIN